MDDDWRNLSRNERRKLKRQRKKERLKTERKEQERGKMKKALKILLPIIILAVIGYYFINVSVAESPRIQVTPVQYDFGDVKAGSSAVSTVMEVGNVGKGSLIINSMDSSCGCTSASMIVDGQEGPRFSMSSHGTNPRDWSVTLKPGETAQLKVYYDPSVHRDSRGPVTRYITLFTNDPINNLMKVRIEANQV